MGRSFFANLPALLKVVRASRRQRGSTSANELKGLTPWTIQTGCHVSTAPGTTSSTPSTDDTRTRPSADFLVHARWAALAAAAGAWTHLALLGAGGWMAFAALAMALACFPCAVKMWRAPSVPAAQMLVGMSLGMGLLHGAVLLAAGPVSGHSHEGSATMTTISSSTMPEAVHAAGTTHTTPMLAAMGVDFAGSMVTASWIRRRSSVAQ